MGVAGVHHSSDAELLAATAAGAIPAIAVEGLHGELVGGKVDDEDRAGAALLDASGGEKVLFW